MGGRRCFLKELEGQRSTQTVLDKADPAEIGGVSCAGNTMLVTSPERGNKPCKGDFFFFSPFLHTAR